MSERVEAVLCDLGHTLVKWSVEREVLRETYRPVHEYLIEHGIHPGPIPEGFMVDVVERVGEIIGASYDRGELDEVDLLSAYADAFHHLGLPTDRTHLERIMELEHTHYVSRLLAPAETLDTLAKLRQRGYKLGLVSNTVNHPRLMLKDLELLGLEPFFDAAVFSSGVGVRKPDRRIYQAVLDQLGVAPARCVFVGDRVREDILGPQALGMRAVLTHEHRQEDPDSAKPDAVIARFSALLDVLDR